MTSGYTNCKCRDCFETAVSDDMAEPDFCNDCEDAGCPGGEAECEASGAYGGDCDCDSEGCSACN